MFSPPFQKDDRSPSLERKTQGNNVKDLHAMAKDTKAGGNSLQELSVEWTEYQEELAHHKVWTLH